MIRFLTRIIARLRAQMAVNATRTQAREEGLGRLTGQDIDALIKKSRASRKR